MFAASAAFVRAFFASGAVGNEPVANREPEGVNRLTLLASCVWGEGGGMGGGWGRREGG